MATSNPVLHENTFAQQPHAAGSSAIGSNDMMTIKGTVSKTLILLALVAFTFMLTWNSYYSNPEGLALPLGMGAGILAFVMSLVMSFKPHLSPMLAPPFALIEGAFLGGISAMYEQAYGTGAGQSGIVVQAMLGTVALFVTMLTLYRTGVIKVTPGFRTAVQMAMLGVVAVYLVSFVLSFTPVQIPYIHESGLIGIGFSVLVLGIASMMLAVDFNTIEVGASSGAPRYMEWYGAFALLVTLVWIYLEMLRLLSKLRSR